MALKRAGVDPTRINLDDPRLQALIEQGATAVEFEGLAAEAIAKHINNPVAWVLKVLPARRKEANLIAENGLEKRPSNTPPTPPWFCTENGLANRAAELGIGSYDAENSRRGFKLTREQYRELVMRADAAARQEHDHGQAH